MSTPQFRFAIMAAVIHQMSQARRDIGKIQLQKLLYFLQNGLGVPLDYRFVMHHYGPYSVQIEDNLSIVRAVGAAQVSVDPEGYGYHITPGETDITAWTELVRPHAESISRVVETLGGHDAARLELLATIHFVRSLRRTTTVEDVLAEVRSLKPKFSVDYIRSAYRELVNSDLMKESASP